MSRYSLVFRRKASMIFLIAVTALCGCGQGGEFAPETVDRNIAETVSVEKDFSGEKSFIWPLTFLADGRLLLLG